MHKHTAVYVMCNSYDLLVTGRKKVSQYSLLVKVLRPTQHKTGHFGDVPQAKPISWLGMEKQNLTQKSTHSPIKKEMYYNTK